MKDWQRQQVERFRQATSEDLHYDFYKNLVSLSLLTIGGMVTIGQGLFDDDLPLRELFWSVCMVGIAGVIAFQAQFEIMRVSNGSNGSMWLRFSHRVAPLAFGAGVGVFLGSIFIPSL